MSSSYTDGGFWKPAAVNTAASDEYGGGGYRGEARNEDDVDSSMLASAAAAASIRRSVAAPLAQQRLLLPIYKHRRQILYAVEHYGVTVITGETGSGKSTQIPQYLVELGGWASNEFQVVCTQPRRIAAVSLAQRVAQEAGTVLGDGVGYAVRFEDQSSPTRTQIKYVTDGLLLRQATLGDPLLSQYSVVMVDEAHEKTIHTDALLGLLKKIRRKRKDLRIIICSATIDAQQFLDFFIGKKQDSTTEEEKSFHNNRGTILSVDGRQHPVDILYREQPAPDYIRCMVETAWQIHRQHPLTSGGSGGGDILCFLPSGQDIDHSIRLAEEQFRDEQQSVEFLPLYGTLPLYMQTRIFQKSDPRPATTSSGSKKRPRAAAAGGGGQPRRIIFATNIAETSVTVPDISFVIDAGLVKLPYFDPRTGLDRLVVGPISRASARQRAGRAGRLGAGKCYRLYTEAYLCQHMAAQTPPEMVRTNLSSLILTLKALGVDNILAFDLMDVPAVDSLAYGLEHLCALGALDEQTTELTPLGLDMSAFPTEPAVARMLLESVKSQPQNCAWEVLGVAAALQVRSLFYKPRRGQQQHQQRQLDYDAAMRAVVDPSGDHVTFANLLAQAEDIGLDDEDEWRNERFVNVVALKRALEVRSQLGRFLRRFGRLGSMLDEETRSRAIRKCVVAGFFFNVAKLANDGRYYTMRRQILVEPCQSSVYASQHASIASSEYIVFGETVDGPRGGIELKSVSAIEARWLREVAPHYWE